MLLGRMFGYCCGTGFSIKLLALWFCSRVDQRNLIDWTLIRRAIQNPNLLYSHRRKTVHFYSLEAKAVSMLIYANRRCPEYGLWFGWKFLRV